MRRPPADDIIIRKGGIQKLFKIDLYNINKKPNSIARPVASNIVSHRVYANCLAKDDSSILAPVVLIKENMMNLVKYNYAYIQDWQRYFYIDDIVLIEGGLCELHLRTDVLATYRNDIRNSSQYVMRASSYYDGDIIDKFYPIKTGITGQANNLYHTVKSVTKNLNYSLYFDKDNTDGEFVIGVIGSNDSGITYYALSYLGFKSLLSNLMTYAPSDMNDVSTGIAKALADPLQYLTTCFWLPSTCVSASDYASRTLKFGDYPITVSCAILPADPIEHLRTAGLITSHPQQSDRGMYLRTSPYSQYILHFNPFGMFNLDGVKLCNSNYNAIACDWYVDCTTGSAELFVYPAKQTGTSIDTVTEYTDILLLHCVIQDYAVPIQLTQLTVNALETAGDYAGVFSSLLHLDFKGMFENVSSAIQSQNPSPSTKGTAGSFLSYRTVDPCLFCQFTELVDEDLDKIGRPLCKTMTLSSLSGYVQTANASISATGAIQAENEMIESMMNAGIFIE